MLDWAEARQIGFSHFVSLGEHADVDFGDMLDYLGGDADTRAILLYIESIDQARKFMSAARSAARNKPVIVIKAGRSAQGQQAAASHTGALAGADNVVDAAIARAGMLRVDTLEQLFLAAEILTRYQAPIGDRMTVLTNGGGVGVLAADAAATEDVPLADLSAPLKRALDQVLPANWSHGNPVDIIGDAPAERYVDALKALGQHPADTGTLLFIHAPTAIVPPTEIARRVPVIRLLGSSHCRWLMGCWVGGPAWRPPGGSSWMPASPATTPEQAVRAIGMLQRYAPQPGRADARRRPPRCQRQHAGRRGADVRALVQSVLASGRDMLDRARSQGGVRGLPHPRGGHAHVPADPTRQAAEAARHRLSGGAQDPFGRHLAQVGRRRRGAEPDTTKRRARRRAGHAGARGAKAAPTRASKASPCRRW
jgi:acetyltransferase